MKHLLETYHLHAYLDGELSPQENAEVEAALKTDFKLNRQFKELKQIKTKISSAYTQHIPQPPVSKPSQTTLANKALWSLPKAAVASLVFGLLIGAGSLKVYENHQPLQALKIEHVAMTNSDNYLVHIDSDLPEKQELAIKEIESLLEDSPKKIKVDLISNNTGVELFDVNNPRSKELTKLLKKYDNLTLFACSRALARARAQGKSLHVLPQVQHDKPAIDAVVERLNLGWNYVKI